jgi:hypothetical protein
LVGLGAANPLLMREYWHATSEGRVVAANSKIPVSIDCSSPHPVDSLSEGVRLHLTYHKGLYAPLISWLVFALHDIINAVNFSGVN